MKKFFKKMNNDNVDIVEYILDMKRKYPEVTVHLGTDSQDHSSGAKFAIVVAFRYGTYRTQNGKGVHFVFQRSEFKRFKNEQVRLKKEIEITMGMLEFLLENNISIDGVEFDFNNRIKTKSSILVQESTGWALYMRERYNQSFVIKTKPDELIAVRAADSLVN